MALYGFGQKLFWGLLLCIFVSSCASPIPRKYREEAAPSVTFPMVLENPVAHKGETVIWGGTIIRTVNDKEGSELFILEMPLGARDKPKTDENPRGRFIARSKAYLDPLIYRKGRRVTVAGKIGGEKEVVSGKGKHPYVYPVVAIEDIHLWKRSAPVYPYYPYGWGWSGPYWGPWPYGYGFYGGGYFGGEFGEGEEFEGEHHEGGFERGEHFEGDERGEEHGR
jgi:outer membrane lipoprotein